MKKKRLVPEGYPIGDTGIYCATREEANEVNAIIESYGCNNHAREWIDNKYACFYPDDSQGTNSMSSLGYCQNEHSLMTAAEFIAYHTAEPVYEIY